MGNWGESRAVAVAVTVALVLVTSCSSDDGDGRAADAPVSSEIMQRVAVDPDGIRGPGTQLAPGVEVVVGSSLIGATFPLFGWNDAGERVETGWQAVMVVDGDPIRVWSGYVEQLGIHDRASAEQACTVSRRGSPKLVPPSPSGRDNRYPTRFLTEPAIDDEDRIECRAVAEGVDIAMRVGQDGCGLVEGTDVPPACREHEIAHLFLQVQTSSDAGGLPSSDGALGTDELRFSRVQDPEGIGGGRENWPIVPPGDVVEPQLSAPQPSRLPVPGERIDGGLDYFLDDRSAPSGGWPTVPAEAASLMAPAMFGFCNSGLVAVLSVPASPEQAVRLFTIDGDSSTIVADTNQAWVLRSEQQAGGYHLDLLAVAQPDGTSVVLATECGD